MFFAPARIAGARLVTFGRDHMSASDLKQKNRKALIRVAPLFPVNLQIHHLLIQKI